MHPLSSLLVRGAALAALSMAACTPGAGDPASSSGGGGSGGGASPGTGGSSSPVAGSSGQGGSGSPAVTGGSSGNGSGGTGATGGTAAGGGSGTGGRPASPGSGGRAGAGADAAIPSGDAGGGAEAPPAGNGKKFSFFVTSIEAMRKQSKSQDGFGGNLGGLDGADKICQAVATDAGAGHKTWKAFLSATKGGANDGPVHAIDRIGQGPWYDFNERLIAMTRADLLDVRPKGDAQAVTDLANEKGQAQKPFGDNHDTITGSNRMGMLNTNDPASTCLDWTSASASAGRNVMGGHSWSRVGRQQWIQEHTLGGCAPGVNLRDNYVAPGNCIGCTGGYGGIYCFALTP